MPSSALRPACAAAPRSRLRPRPSSRSCGDEHPRRRRARRGTHFASSSAAARPIPLAAPVMTATRPAWITGCTPSSISVVVGSNASECDAGRRGDGRRLPFRLRLIPATGCYETEVYRFAGYGKRVKWGSSRTFRESYTPARRKMRIRDVEGVRACPSELSPERNRLDFTGSFSQRVVLAIGYERPNIRSRAPTGDRNHHRITIIRCKQRVRMRLVGSDVTLHHGRWIPRTTRDNGAYRTCPLRM